MCGEENFVLSMWSRSVERGTVPRARPPMHSAGSTKGVVAIVGCGLGLGGAIAGKFASEGYTIAAMARSQESLDAVKDSLAKVGSAKHGFYSLDATKKAEVDATFEKIVSDLGAVSVLVYNVSDSPKGLRTTLPRISSRASISTASARCCAPRRCCRG